MQKEIIKHINEPKQLEMLYRKNKSLFKSAFNNAYPHLQENAIAHVWNERLNFENEEISWGSNNELTFIIFAAIFAGIVAKFPDIFFISPEIFYSRNIAFIVFPFLTAYFAWKNNLSTKKIIIISAVFLFSIGYINLLPDNENSDTLILACIHLPLVLWFVLGYAFTDNTIHNHHIRFDYLRFNGDLLVMITLIVISGVLLSAISLALFELIDVSVEVIYTKYIAVIGLAASPIVGTYLVQTNPHLVNKVSPVIAKVFTPLVLLTLLIYLAAVLYSGKDPYNDRDFLLIFNVLLIGVMAIILFAIAERSKNTKSKIGTFMLLALSMITILINGIALTAIVFRISEWGFTPNRLAVLGGNILILINLMWVTFYLFKSLKDENAIQKVEHSITSYLPIYCVWAAIVAFVFPLIFNFR